MGDGRLGTRIARWALPAVTARELGRSIPEPEGRLLFA